MKPDIELARETKLQPIARIAADLHIDEENLIPYGKFKAKVDYRVISDEKIKQSSLILVTAITPTKAGIGKTTTSISLAQGLQQLGKKAVLALREPSLGPCFGMKGGATGGGYSQVLPMDEINLHFTGDFHAITSANNMLAALLDNYIYHNRNSDKPQLKQVLWRRVLDVNDRSLRQMVSGLGGSANGIPAETGFDITPASEIMAILCLAKDLEDLENRINNILLGYTTDNEPFFVRDLGVGGAITVLLKDAIHPNLVQTMEGGGAFVHGGPFANIAHGCNSLMATRMAMSTGDFVITEAGFGADLGAEKFFDIKCRVAGLNPKASVLVVTSQALKLHGGVEVADISKPNEEGLKLGLLNVGEHLKNLQQFGQSVVVAFNQYHFDTEEEIAIVRHWCEGHKAAFALNNGFTQGGKGAVELAQTVLDLIEKAPSADVKFAYDLEDSIEDKIRKVVVNVYGGKFISFSPKAALMLKRINRLGFDKLPICIAKTQYSFSDNPAHLGVAQDFEFKIADLIINSGAGFIVAVAGEMMRMPGLPKSPQAERIFLKDGEIEGLS
ncbi:formate--tetrahydrofolate ligase [Adhaeribacter soli]|uniref:Formate--tetrahydrofolate ligase n=1 Tax=Adhaeribacter soli TaxID=2607655 RepID=A0A5N1IT89_9BACT|nr:formate--tetrahydrofolate ligase [Adhaeribacter soli]KAA9332868.1 formate--tetrahydrofolate ligase [Adhaeribacter soli]